MNIQRFAPVLLLSLAGAFSSWSAVAGVVGDQMEVEQQPASTLTRAEVRAETLAAMKRGELRHTAYDEQESAVVARDQKMNPPVANSLTRQQVQAEARAYFKSHPHEQFERDTYGVAG